MYILTAHVVTEISIAIDDKGVGVVSGQQDECVLGICHGIGEGNGFLQLQRLLQGRPVLTIVVREVNLGSCPVVGRMNILIMRIQIKYSALPTRHVQILQSSSYQ